MRRVSRATRYRGGRPNGKDGKRKVAVTVGISNGAKTEILSGVNEGQQVVLQ